MIKIITPPAPSLCVQYAQGTFDLSIILWPSFGLKNNNAKIVPKKMTQTPDTTVSDGDTTVIV